MPPRIAPSDSQPRGRGRSRGRGGGGGAGRGGGGRGGVTQGSGPALVAAAPSGAPGLPAAHIETVGVKRPGYGTAGRAMKVFTNHFSTTTPESIIHHYDVVISPSGSDKVLPPRANLEIITRLQETEAQIFTPPAVYDGKKNLFAPKELSFGASGQFEVTLGPARNSPPDNDAPRRQPRSFKVILTKVNEINPEVLTRFINGQQSHDNTVLTAIMALNVVIRMQPTMRYPFNARSFFTDRETKDIGSGLILWRGYFQSVRPAVGQMLINVDISTGTMYKPGPLISLCLEYLRKPNNPDALSNLADRERIQLQKFLSGLRVLTNKANDPPNRAPHIPRVIKRLSARGANELTFQMRDGETMTVAEYFRRVRNNRPLRFPRVICIEIGSGALIPLELCSVSPGQIMKKPVPPEKTKDVLEFATKRPGDRLQSIVNGLQVLQYGQSPYVREFGMAVDDAAGPMETDARVLKPPVLKYGQGSRQMTIQPANGSWNMMDKKFFKISVVERWVVVIYERQQRFGPPQVQDMVQGLLTSCEACGIQVRDRDPIIKWENGQGRVSDQLRAIGMECRAKKGNIPDLIVVILPEGGNDIYTAVKHFGDITVGVATQCLKSSKCFRAKAQYYANVCLKINVKRGGINTIPEPSSVTILTDPRNPTIVMGADVIHPAPGSDGRPSFTALVANVDSDTAKYIADSRVQTSRKEMIEDLLPMAKHVLGMYMIYRQRVEGKPANQAPPKRIIFYRDGVSEGQFRHVLEQELPLLKQACTELKINPTITFIIVGKRHHVRFFPKNPSDADRSGNCPAGTVVDRVIAHPVEFDFYLQSHGGLLGTSRPAHYNVLHDENGFSADGLQSLSFALCHVYARATRSVSIPAPVYYADIVCTRAKNHYDPLDSGFDFSDSATNLDSGAADNALEGFRRRFRPLHENMKILMYFS